MKYILKNGIIVNEGKRFIGCLYINNGIIEKYTEGVYKEDINKELSYNIIDVSNCYVIPGLIDEHVHFREPGLSYKGNIYSESRAAAAGGVTSFMDMPNTIPQCLNQEILEEKYKIAAKNSLINYSFYMGCSEDNLEEVLKTNPKTVCGIKLFLGSSTGGMLVKDTKYLDILFKKAPCLIAVHCEDEDIIQENTKTVKEQYGENPPFKVHPIVRSEEACFKSANMTVALARKHSARLHLLHLSTEKEIALLDNNPNIRDRKISGEVCIPHLWFSKEDFDKFGAKIKCNPAIKSKKDRAALRSALKKGLLVVATDHAPHSLEEKAESYFKCPSGAPSIQDGLKVMLQLCDEGVLSIEDVVEACCHKPANLFNIQKRGFIREGYCGDIAVIGRSKELNFKEKNLYRCAWSPFENVNFNHKVVHTFVNGNLVYSKGNIIKNFPCGERLIFE